MIINIFFLIILTALSTWGKKVGQKWDQLKRSDSSEILSPSEKRNWPSCSQNNSVASLSSLSSESELSQKNLKRISRVESLRNLFQRNDKACCSSDQRKSSDLVNNNMSSDCLKNERLKNLYQICNIIKENEIQEKNGENLRTNSRKIEEFLSNFEEEEEAPENQATTEKNSLYTKHSKTINAVRNMFTLKSTKSLDQTVRKDKRKQVRINLT